MMKATVSFVILAIITNLAIAAKAEQKTITDTDAKAATTERGYYGAYHYFAKPGGYCTRKRDCYPGFICESHICKVKAGKKCTSYPTLCESGSLCLGTPYKKKCVIPSGLGGSCGFSPFKVCKAGLLCRGHICVSPAIPLGGSCIHPGSVCASGLVCAGTRRYKTCVRIRGPGETCKKRNPFFICKSGLFCYGGVCTTPENGDCEPAGSVCEAGAVCVGYPGKKRCVFPRGVGRECGNNPFRICKSGLLCIGHVCKEPKIPLGGSCIHPGSECEHGLVCAGTRRYKTCVRVRGPGEKCKKRNPFFICGDGLVCKGGICKTPKGGSCLAAGSVCVRGTKCVGTPHKKLCVKPMPVGGRCGADPFWICDYGLDCVGHVCKYPKIPEGGSCKAPGSVCADGLVCVGRRRRKFCRRLRVLGEKCKTRKGLLCAPGLVCRRRRCSLPVVPVGGDCLPAGSVCARGSVCVGTPHKKVCARPSGRGGSCGTPFLFCKSKLACLNHVCVSTRRKIGERCGGAVRCKRGLSCMFIRHRKKALCMRVSRKGGRCGGFNVCPQFLKCIHGRCLRKYYHW